MAILRQCFNYRGRLVSMNPCWKHSVHKSAALTFHSYHLMPHCHGYQRTAAASLARVRGFLSVSDNSTLCQPKCTQMYKRHKAYKQQSSLSVPKVTLDTIFSSSNKERLQNRVLNRVEHYISPQNKTGKSSGNSQAAVLIPLCVVEGEPSVLFTLRSTSLRQHRGQVSFPGGKIDETDRDVIHTALRETQEELGIAMETVDVWGTMIDVPTRDKRLVTPVLGYCGDMDISKLTLSEDEVELVFTRTIKSLCDLRNIGHTQFRSGYTLPVFLGEHRIWGLTSFVLHLILTDLAPGIYQYKLKHRS